MIKCDICLVKELGNDLRIAARAGFKIEMTQRDFNYAARTGRK